MDTEKLQNLFENSEITGYIKKSNKTKAQEPMVSEDRPTKAKYYVIEKYKEPLSNYPDETKYIVRDLENIESAIISFLAGSITGGELSLAERLSVNEVFQTNLSDKRNDPLYKPQFLLIEKYKTHEGINFDVQQINELSQLKRSFLEGPGTYCGKLSMAISLNPLGLFAKYDIDSIINGGAADEEN